MEKYIIEGGHKLEGEVSVTGAKNAVLGMIPAALLAKGETTLENVPEISDVRVMIAILEGLGAQVEFDDHKLVIDTTYIDGYNLTEFEDKFSNLRASYYFWGALIARNSGTFSPLPGGCEIGDRDIDLHIKGLKALGVRVQTYPDLKRIEFKSEDSLKGNYINLDIASVGATINIMLAAITAEGRTTIENAAKEPHVVDIANFLNQMGAQVRGAGTDTIKITGVETLHPCCYSVVTDQIVTGTYMIAAAVTEGDVTIKDAIPKHMEALTSKLREMGVNVEVSNTSIRVQGKRPFKAANVRTQFYPGFPTDLQQLIAVVMALSDGECEIRENLYENRFNYIEELKRMGLNAEITKNNRLCTIQGGSPLYGASIKASDLRAGAALVLAGLCADGITEITGINYIDRGYENFEESLRSLGAVIERVEIDEDRVEAVN